MRGITRGLLALGAVLAAGAADAKEQEGSTLGVSVEASALLGFGVSVGMPLGDRFNLRGAYHGFTYDKEFEDSDNGATYDGELELKTLALFGDWHPFAGAFRLTAGFMSNGNQINLSGTPSGGQFSVGTCTFQSDPADPMRVTGTVDFKSTAPYLGIGWGGNMNAAPGFYGTLDLGVMFSGAPESKLEGRGRARNANPAQASTCGDPVNYQDVSSYPEFQRKVQEEEANMNDETKDFKLWPNIAIGLGWRF